MKRAWDYETPSMSVKREWDWSVIASRRAVHISEARMGLVNGHDVLPSQSRNGCPRCRGQTTVQNCTGGHATICLIIRKRDHQKLRMFS